jgi:hypothetical protein
MLEAKRKDNQTRVAEGHFQEASAEYEQGARCLEFIQSLEPMIADSRQFVVSVTCELS